MTDELKVSIRNASLSAIAGVVVAVGSCLAFVGRTEYRIAEVDANAVERLTQHEKQQKLEFEKVNSDVNAILNEMRLLMGDVRSDIRDLYQSLLKQKKD